MLNVRWFSLLLLSFRSTVHKLRHHWGKELVTLAASLVLIGLFFYIFNDFINFELKSISIPMKNFFAKWVSYIILAVVTIACSKILRQDRKKHQTIRSLCLFLGEHHGTVRKYLISKFIIIILVYYSFGWYLVLGYFSVPAVSTAILTQLSAAVCLALFYYFPEGAGSRDQKNPRQLTHHLKGGGKIYAMFFWRVEQMLYRNRLSQISLVMAFLFAFLAGVLAVKDGPFFIIVFCAFICGQCSAFALIFQIVEDFRCAWAERYMGVSHNDVVNTYSLIGILLGFLFGILCFLSVIISWEQVDQKMVLAASKLFFIVLLSPLSVPTLLFQIEPRRPMIQIACLALTGLFLSTAIYAHYLSVILLPVLKYYGDDYQKGRFYRA
ncbi:MAG: hypothetical protein HQK54_08255 [Oligoflexales bacterium]|nr:hypothetical protein [Oligoflexales bacterium]